MNEFIQNKYKNQNSYKRIFIEMNMVKIIIFDFDGVIVDSFGPAFDLARKYSPNIKLNEYKKLFEGNILIKSKFNSVNHKEFR